MAWPIEPGTPMDRGKEPTLEVASEDCCVEMEVWPEPRLLKNFAANFFGDNNDDDGDDDASSLSWTRCCCIAYHT
eukprot:209292-Pelagomonas_calceolata.AAC.4